MMIRAFDLRDLTLVHRLREQGISLHVETDLTNDRHALRGALATMLVGGSFPTFIWKDDEVEVTAFVQLQLKSGCSHAHMVYLGMEGAPSEPPDEDIWLPLLDQLAVEVGKRKIHGLVAEVSESSPVLPVLRRAGYAVYTRQDVWVLPHSQPQETTWLRPRQPVDDWDVQLLYANTVPRLIQMVEPVSIFQVGESWVMREEDELVAMVHLHKGPSATWLRLFIHPTAHARANEILQESIQLATPGENHPLYACVRRYQSWLQQPLAAAGFQAWGSQAVMVKHVVQHGRKALTPEISPGLEAKTAPTSSSVVSQTPYQSHPERSTK